MTYEEWTKDSNVLWDELSGLTVDPFRVREFEIKLELAKMARAYPEYVMRFLEEDEDQDQEGATH